MKKILLIDDDHPYRSRLARSSSEQGYEILEASTPSEAMLFLHDLSIDGVVLDLNLPGGSGLKLIEPLRTALPNARIIIVTGYGSIATATTALKDGAHDYLTKPAPLEGILNALHGRKALSTPTHFTTPTLEQVENEHLNRILVETNGNISKTAKLLGLHRRSLQRKLARTS